MAEWPSQRVSETLVCRSSWHLSRLGQAPLFDVGARLPKPVWIDRPTTFRLDTHTEALKAAAGKIRNRKSFRLDMQTMKPRLTRPAGKYRLQPLTQPPPLSRFGNKQTVQERGNASMRIHQVSFGLPCRHGEWPARFRDQKHLVIHEVYLVVG